MLDRIKNNLTLKLLSILIAVVAWAYLRLTPNPVIAAHFVQQVDVPVSTVGLASDEVARYDDKTAIVAVDVGRGGSVRPDMLRAVLNVSGRGPGVYNIPVEVIAPKFEVRSLSPASITLTIERLGRRTIPVVAHYFGDARRTVVVGKPEFAPAFATIYGPTSDLARAASVRVDVPLPGGPSTFDAMVRPNVADDRGADLAGIGVEPNLVRVRVRFVSPTKR